MAAWHCHALYLHSPAIRGHNPSVSSFCSPGQNPSQEVRSLLSACHPPNTALPLPLPTLGTYLWAAPVIISAKATAGKPREGGGTRQQFSNAADQPFPGSPDHLCLDAVMKFLQPGQLLLPEQWWFQIEPRQGVTTQQQRQQDLGNLGSHTPLESSWYRSEGPLRGSAVRVLFLADQDSPGVLEKLPEELCVCFL